MFNFFVLLICGGGIAFYSSCEVEVGVVIVVPC